MKNQLISLIFIFAISIILVFSIFSSASQSSFEKHFCNSDTLYLPSVYNDIFTDHNSISNFNLNPAPNFFPDMVFHFILMKCCNSKFILVAMLFASFQTFFFNSFI